MGVNMSGGQLTMTLGGEATTRAGRRKVEAAAACTCMRNARTHANRIASPRGRARGA
jgi:hypothetical protein